jgi:nitrate reductase (NAD(P)H)
MTTEYFRMCITLQSLMALHTVFRTMVTPQMSDEIKNWRKDDRYAIYELSVNSAIAHPGHDERLEIAYGGGGRRVTRAEITPDKGESWRLANINYPEDRYREAKEQDLYGGVLDMSWRESSFCWCFGTSRFH